MTQAWHVVQHKPRLEDAAVQDLKTLGIENFRPLYRESDNAHPVALFPGYVFAHFDACDALSGWTEIKRSPAVLRLLITREGVPASLIEDLMRAMDRGKGAVLFNDDQIRIRGRHHMRVRSRRKLLIYGQKVRIREGPFSGFQGTFDGYTHKRAIIVIDAIRRYFRVWLKEHEVEVLA